MTATTDRERLLQIADDLHAMSVCGFDTELRTIAATLPPPYSPQPPTVEGWYWWRWKPDAEPMIMRCVKDENSTAIYFWDNTKWSPIRGMQGEWSGPIPQPPN